MSSRIATFLREAFRFDVAPAVADWAEKNLIIPRKMSPARPGPLSFARNPTSRPILDCFHPASGVRSCTNVAGAQVSKTLEGVVGTAYRICHSPMPTLILGPSEDWLRLEISEKRLMALIEANPVLARHKPRDPSLFRKMSMDMIGGTIALEGANSPVATAGSTQGIVWIEEAAKIEHQDREDAPEAHPIKLAFERTKAFRGVDLHYLSFTANHERAVAWQYYLAGTQTHFPVPCPHCGEYFPLEFEIKKDGDDIETILEESVTEARPSYYRSLRWEPDAQHADGSWNEARVRDTVRYICPFHGCEITEADRLPMINKFEQQDKNLAAPPSLRSFRRPSFYSPTITFGDMALEFLRSKPRNDLFTTGFQNFYNSWLALCWSVLAKNIKESHVLKLRGTHVRGVLPCQPALLLLTSDPGERATHWTVCAILHTGEILLIDWGVVTGPEEMLAADFIKARGYLIAGTDQRRFPDIGYIDSGWSTERVYDICENSHGFFWPTKGTKDGWGSWKETVAASRPHLRLFTYSDTQEKDELCGRLVYGMKSPRLWLPADVTSDVILSMSGQQKDRQTGKWKELPQDHFNDCIKLAVVGRHIGRTFLTQMATIVH